jgi:RNA polymerase sigma-70 factor (ECF subfamily)
MDDDKQLIQRTLAGEKEAFEMIILKYQQPLLNYIGRTLGQYELALEFTQEVFIKTSAGGQPPPDPSHPDPG